MVAFVRLFIVFDSGVLSVCLYAFLNGLMFFLLLFWTFHSVLRVNGHTISG